MEKVYGEPVEITRKKGAILPKETSSKTDYGDAQRRNMKDQYLSEAEDGESKGNSRIKKVSENFLTNGK